MNNALADKENHDRLRVLDGLRAIAVLLVVFMHSIRAQWIDITQPFLNIPGDTLATILYNGWVGVDLFFVLSGFLIARQLLRFSPGAHMPRARYFLYYLKVRFFRIAPAYYLTLIIFLAVSWGLRSAQGHMVSADQLSDWGTRLMAHILFMHDYFPPLKMSVLWSLAVEAKFYLLAPFLVWSIIRIPVGAQLPVMAGIIIALIALRLSALSSSPYDLGVYDNYFFHIRTQFHLSLDALLAGVMCAMMWHNQKIRNKIQELRTANILFLSGLIILVSVTCHHLIYVPRVSFYEMAWLPAILALGFSLTMLGLLGGCYGYRFFENKFFSRIALISYSLYLTHCFFLGSQSHVAQMIAQATGIQNLSILWLLSLPVYLLLSAGTAILLHRFVERPFILWSKSTPHTP